MPAWRKGWEDGEICGLKEGFHYQMHDEAGNGASHNSKTKGAEDGQELAEGLKSHIIKVKTSEKKPLTFGHFPKGWSTRIQKF